LFDGPDTNSSTDVRSRSTVPLQALHLMNSPFVREAAAGLARRLIAASSMAEARITLGYELAWGRPPSRPELGRALRFVHQATEALAAAGTPAETTDREAWASLAKVLLTANEFLYVD